MLNIDKFARNQCESLTRDQVTSLELGAFRTAPLKDGCRWSTDEKTTFDVGFAKSDALGQAYRDANKEFWTVFEPFDINGFPAVERQHPTDSNVYDCFVTVAVGPDLAIEVEGMNTGQPVDWCAKSVAAARYVVHNLGG